MHALHLAAAAALCAALAACSTAPPRGDATPPALQPFVHAINAHDVAAMLEAYATPEAQEVAARGTLSRHECVALTIERAVEVEPHVWELEYAIDVDAVPMTGRARFALDEHDRILRETVLEERLVPKKRARTFPYAQLTDEDRRTLGWFRRADALDVGTTAVGVWACGLAEANPLFAWAGPAVPVVGYGVKRLVQRSMANDIAADRRACRDPYRGHWRGFLRGFYGVVLTNNLVALATACGG